MIPILAAHLCQSTFFMFAVALLTLAFRGNRAQVRYWLWLTASVKFLVPFALLMSLGSALESRAPVAAQMIATPAVSLAAEYVVQPFPDTLSPARSASHGTDWIPLTLLAVWVCGFLAIAIVRVRSWFRIRAAVRAGIATDIPATVEVRVSPGFLEPGVVGLLRPILLLPDGITERLTASELKAVLTHELCHVHRRDNLFAAIHMVVETVFWFHPFVWWIGARLVEERERACDEEVLSQGNAADVYADAILCVCKQYVESPLACVSGVSGASIRRRIEAIMSNRSVYGLNSAKTLLLTLSAVVALIMPITIGLVIGISNMRVVRAQPAMQPATPAAVPVAQTQIESVPNAIRQPSAIVVPKFDAVSIRPCELASGGGRGPNGGSGSAPPPRTAPGRLYFTCVSVQELVGRAYVQFADGRIHPQWVPPTVEGMPDWARMNPGPAFDPANRYTLEARAEGTPSQEMMMGPMLQAVLEERFKLKMHREARDMPAYALTIAKGGARLSPYREGTCFNPDFTKFPPASPPPDQMRCENGTGKKGPNIVVANQAVSLGQLALELSNSVSRLVVDKTGITGLFDIEFEYGPDENTPLSLSNSDPNSFCSRQSGNLPICRTPTLSAHDPAGPSIFTVLEKQLGLKLEPTTGKKDFLVIDHVERPSEN